MQEDESPEDIILEGELISSNVSGLTPQQQMERAAQLKAKMLKPSKKQKRINVTKIMNEYGYNPVVTQILIATNQWQLLGLKGPVTAHEINSSSQYLLALSVPAIKPVDFINPEEEIVQVPIYVEKRGVQGIEPPKPTPEDDEDDSSGD